MKNNNIVKILIVILILLILSVLYLVFIKKDNKNTLDNNVTTTKVTTTKYVYTKSDKTSSQLNAILNQTFTNYDKYGNVYDFDINIGDKLYVNDLPKNLVYKVVYNNLLYKNLVTNTSKDNYSITSFKKSDFNNYYKKLFNIEDDIKDITINDNVYTLNNDVYEYREEIKTPTEPIINNDIDVVKYLPIDYVISDNILTIDVGVYYYKISDSEKIYQDKDFKNYVCLLSEINDNITKFKIYRYHYDINNKDNIFTYVERVN